MKNTSRNYSRRPTWDADLLIAQKDLHDSITNLAPLVQNQEDKLTYLYRQDSSNFGIAAHAFITSLDEKWSHHQDVITAVGGQLVPGPLQDFISQEGVEFSYKQDITTGTNYGFNVAYDHETNRMRIGLYQDLGSLAISSTSYQLTGSKFAIVPLDNASFTMSIPKSRNEQSSINVEHTRQLMQSALIQYEKQILNPHSSFYLNPKAKRQNEILQAISDVPNRELPNALSNETLLLSGDFPCLYTFDAATRRILTQRSNTSEPLSLTGSVQGFTSLECLGGVEYEPISSPSELLDPDAGLLAGVDLIGTNNRLQSDELLYYVPLRLGQNINLYSQ